MKTDAPVTTCAGTDVLDTRVEKIVIEDLARALCATLPAKGLDRMTPDKIEFILCTSALTAHI